MSSTTRLYHTSTISPSRRHRDEEYLEEPKLWEVQTTTSEVKQQLEDLNVRKYGTHPFYARVDIHLMRSHYLWTYSQTWIMAVKTRQRRGRLNSASGPSKNGGELLSGCCVLDAEPFVSRKRARSTTPLPEPKYSDLESQVTVFVAMPTPGGRMPGQPMREYAIGTRSMAYSSTGEQVVIPPKQSSPTRIRPCSSRTSSSTEIPIIAELSAYGYFF